MSARKLAVGFAAGFFAIAFLRNGTAGKLVKIGSSGAQVLTGGTAKISRKI